jgi:hypothetical protein
MGAQNAAICFLPARGRPPRYGQYKDQIGVYSGKDHGSKSRRAAYFKRHSGVDSKAAALAKEFKNAGHHTAKTLSHTYLW